MTDAVLVIPPGWRATDADDLPISGAKLKFYAAGTTTPVAVYSDNGLLSSLGATVTCDAGGYPTSDGSTKTTVYTGTDDYKLVLTDADDVTIWSHDNIKGAVTVPTTGSTAQPEIPVTSKTSTYTVVAGDAGKLIDADPSGGSFLVTLPSAITVGDGFCIGVRHNGTSTSNTVSVRTTGGQTIGMPGQASATSVALTSLGHTLWFVSNGAGYKVHSVAPPQMQGGLVVIRVEDRLTAPPASPVGGSRYIINGTATGVWASLSFAEHDVAEADGNGSWLKYTPKDGWLAYVADENLYTSYQDSAWVDLANATAPSTAALGYAVFEERQLDGTDGGTSVATTWTSRVPNTEVVNTVTGCSLSGGAITLAAGYYLISAEQQIYNEATTQISTLAQQRIAAGTAVLNATLLGIPSRTGGGAVGSGVTTSTVDTQTLRDTFFVRVTTGGTINLQYWVTRAQATNGLGYASTETTVGYEVFARVSILDLTSLQGPQGVAGPQGPEGLDAAYPYQWSSSTSGDPGSGKVAVNNATLASATQLAISETGSDGASLAAVIATWDDSTSSDKGTFKWSKEGATGNFLVLRITGAGTDQGTYWTFPVEYVATGGTLTNTDDGAAIFIEKGDLGDPGTTVPDISSLTDLSPANAGSDYWIMYDSSAGSHKKVRGDHMALRYDGAALTANSVGPLAAQTAIWVDGTLSGTMPASSIQPYSYIKVTDTVDAETTATAYLDHIAAMHVHHVMSTGSGGNRVGIIAQFDKTGSNSGGTTGSHDFWHGMFAKVNVSAAGADTGGTSGNPYGNFYGGAAGIFVTNPASTVYWNSAGAWEFDISLPANINVLEKYLIQLSQTNDDAAQGVNVDAAIVVANDGLAAHPGWTNLIQLGKSGSYWPMDTTEGQLIAVGSSTAGTIQMKNGFNLSGITFTNRIMQATGLDIYPDGQVYSAGLVSYAPSASLKIWDTAGTVSAGALHRIVSTGNSAYWQINTAAGGDFSSAVTALTVGASGISAANFAAGGTISFGSGDVLATHSTNALAFTGATNGYSFDAVVSAGNMVTNGGQITLGSERPWQFEAQGTGASTKQALRPLSDSKTFAIQTSDTLTDLIQFVSSTSFPLIKLGVSIEPLVAGTPNIGSLAAGMGNVYLAAGKRFDFGSGDVYLLHGTNALSFYGGASGYSFDAVVKPVSNDGAALGSGSVAWSDLFLASGGVINWNNGTTTFAESDVTNLKGAWSSYATTLTAGTGTYTSASATVYYKTVGKTMHLRVNINITTNGTAGTYTQVTLPATSAGSSQVIVGSELASAGFALTGYVSASSSVLIIRKYDATYAGADGYSFALTGTIEIA